jgi:hypothetical protein
MVLRRYEEDATNSPNGFALYRAPGEMPAVRVVAVPAGLGFGEFTPGDKGFQFSDTFGPRTGLSDVCVGVSVTIPALLGRAKGDESADCELPRQLTARVGADRVDLRLDLVSIVSVFTHFGNDECYLG